MERIMAGGMLPLILTSVGVLLLYQILVRFRRGASVRGAVVVITGASSGLGKGWRPIHFYFTERICGIIQYLHHLRC